MSSTRHAKRCGTPALLVAALLTTLSGCGDRRPSVRAERPERVRVASRTRPKLPVTVTSADGLEVTVRRAARIVVLNGGIGEIVVALGLGERVVGRDQTTTISELATATLVTRSHDVSAESVLSLRPDVVLADTNSGPPEALDQLRGAGVPVVVVDQATKVGDIGDRIAAIGDALGVGAVARRLSDDTTARIRAAGSHAAGTPKRSVAFLYLRGRAGVALLGGPDSGADSMIAAAGGLDAGTAAGLTRAFTPLTAEALVTTDPDVLLLTTTGLDSVGGVMGLLAMPGIAQTSAGVNRRIITLEDGLLFGFGTRSPAAIERLAAGIAAAGSGTHRTESR